MKMKIFSSLFFLSSYFFSNHYTLCCQGGRQHVELSPERKISKNKLKWMQREWPLYFCQQLLPGPFSTICTNQWNWIHSLKAAAPITPHSEARHLTPAAAWSQGTKPIIAPLNADAVTGKCCLWRKCPMMTTFTAGWLLSLIHHSHILRWFAYSLPAAYRQQQPFSLCLVLLFSIFPHSPSPSLCPASANPSSQMLYPRNLMEVIWLPINRADRGKTPGQRTAAPIMLNAGRMERKPKGP